MYEFHCGQGFFHLGLGPSRDELGEQDGERLALILQGGNRVDYGETLGQPHQVRLVLYLQLCNASVTKL